MARGIYRQLMNQYAWCTYSPSCFGQRSTWSVVTHSHRLGPGQVSNWTRAFACHHDMLRHLQYGNTDIFIFRINGACSDHNCRRNMGKLLSDQFHGGSGTMDGDQSFTRWKCGDQYRDWAERVFLQREIRPECWLLISGRWNPLWASVAAAIHIVNDISVIGKGCAESASFFAPYIQ